MLAPFREVVVCFSGGVFSNSNIKFSIDTFWYWRLVSAVFILIKAGTILITIKASKVRVGKTVCIDLSSNIKIWETYCSHLNKRISFSYGNNKYNGIFKGIDKRTAQRIANVVKPGRVIQSKLYVELGDLWDKGDKKGFEKHLKKLEKK